MITLDNVYLSRVIIGVYLGLPNLFRLYTDPPSSNPFAMETLPIPSETQAVGVARHIDEYAAAGARYVTTGQQGAANTQRAYAGDWKRFTAWCREHGRDALPANVLTVAAFVTALAEAGKRSPPSSATTRPSLRPTSWRASTPRRLTKW